MLKENECPSWYVMRAYKTEKKAEEILRGKNGLEYYIPKHYVVRVYHGVKSKRLVPVIPSLIFVRASHKQILEFKKYYNFLQFVMWNKQDGLEYLIVPDYQMDNFIKVTSCYEENTTFHNPDEIDLTKGTRVRILGGRFDKVEGTFMRVAGKRNRRLVVMLEGVMAASVEVAPDLIEILK